METKEEGVAGLLEEDRRYRELIGEYRGDRVALAEADRMYQEGVRVDEIRRVLAEGEAVGDEPE